MAEKSRTPPPEKTELAQVLAALTGYGPDTLAVDLGLPPSGAVEPARPERFQSIERLAQGGLGQVSIALDTQLKRKVALKEIRPDRRGEMVRRRFLAEAEITGQLEHPGIVPIYALERDAKGEPYYAMRLITGTTLGEAIAAYHAAPTPLQRRELLQRLVSVCQTVAYAHSKRVIHRDLKPANIMLGAFGETLVVDWGLAKRMDSDSTWVAADAVRPGGDATIAPPEADSTLLAPPASGTDPQGLTQAGDILGTPAYMSPEQTLGRPDELGTASDIYSLGAILYEILAGRPPFQGDPFDVMLDVREGRLKSPSYWRPTNKSLEAICLRAMARTPGDRYPSAQALAQDIERFLADEPVVAYAEPFSQRLRRWLKRRRTLVVGATAALIVAAVALGVAAFVVSLKNAQLSATNRQLQTEEARTLKALAGERERRRQAYLYLDDMTSQLVGDAAMQRRELTLTPAQREFLERALRSYQEIADSADDDFEGRLSMGHALLRVAQLHHRFRDEKAAESSVERALALLRNLAQEQPNRLEPKEYLAGAYGELGRIKALQRDLPAAGIAEHEALRLREEILAASPKKAEMLMQLAGCNVNLAMWHEDLNKVDEARQYHAKALASAEQAAAAAPGNSRIQQRLASIIYDQCSFYQGQEQYDAAAACARKAIALLEPLAAASKVDPDALYDLALAHNNLGASLHAKGDFASAQTAFAKATSIYDRILQILPGEPMYRLSSAEVLHNEFMVAKDQGHRGTAVKHLRQAIERVEPLLQLTPNHVPTIETMARNQHWLAEMELEQNHLDEALAARLREISLHEQMLSIGSAAPETRFHLASGCFALASLHNARGETRQAIETYAKARPIYEQLIHESPRTVGYSASLAGIDCNLAGIYLKTDLSKVPALLDAAQQRLEGILNRQPNYEQAKINLRNVWLRRSEYFIATNEPAKAGAAQAKADELSSKLKQER